MKYSYNCYIHKVIARTTFILMFKESVDDFLQRKYNIEELDNYILQIDEPNRLNGDIINDFTIYYSLDIYDLRIIKTQANYSGGIADSRMIEGSIFPNDTIQMSVEQKAIKNVNLNNERNARIMAFYDHLDINNSYLLTKGG